MVCDRTDPVEDFLVEHVMLGLGNIRLALGEIGPGADPVTQSLALRRIAGRIDDIEARARLLLHHGTPRDGAPDGEPPTAPAIPAIFASRRRPN